MFDPEHLDETCEALAAADNRGLVHDARVQAAKARIADCDSRLDRYRATLEAGTDAALVGHWIAEVRAERIAAERQHADAAPAPRLTKDEISALSRRSTTWSPSSETRTLQTRLRCTPSSASR